MNKKWSHRNARVVGASEIVKAIDGKLIPIKNWDKTVLEILRKAVGDQPYFILTKSSRQLAVYDLFQLAEDSQVVTLWYSIVNDGHWDRLCIRAVKRGDEDLALGKKR